MKKELSGVGIGLRPRFLDQDEILATRRRIDFLELIPENWVTRGGRRRAQLSACVERWLAVPHSVSLNIGGLDPLDGALLDALAELCEVCAAPFFSDHLVYSSVAGQPLHDLLPLPFTEEVVAHVAARHAEAERRVGRPLVLENATFYSHMPGSTMGEAEFLRAVCEAADCGLLLDVNNVYVNSQNHGFDPYQFIDKMPLARVRQLHLAGHTLVGDTIIDTHIGPIIEPVWSLYRHTLRRAGRLIPTLIEWDQDIPPLDEVLDEADRARAEAVAVLGEECV
ncbi:MAG: DUF692 domain-containing protein [Deltaproteobacteria bacterium]|nr:DUF692 domain-containing protein [Deltaproteobacteria bacterium]